MFAFNAIIHSLSEASLITSSNFLYKLLGKVANNSRECSFSLLPLFFPVFPGATHTYMLTLLCWAGELCIEYLVFFSIPRFLRDAFSFKIHSHIRVLRAFYVSTLVLIYPSHARTRSRMGISRLSPLVQYSHQLVRESSRAHPEGSDLRRSWTRFPLLPPNPISYKFPFSRGKYLVARKSFCQQNRGRGLVSIL